MWTEIEIWISWWFPSARHSIEQPANFDPTTFGHWLYVTLCQNAQ